LKLWKKTGNFEKLNNPADKVEKVDINRLIPYARNARTHSDAQVDQIAASIREWGWTTPVLVDPDFQIIAGHGRVMAAKKLGIAEVPVMVANGWSDAKKRAYVLADNKLALNAGWDEEILKLELDELQELGGDIELIGFSDDELAALNPEAEQVPGLTDEDAVPEIPDLPVTVEGDVWLLGRHRLMCGDSTSIDAVENLMAGEIADLCFTSPPYGQQRDYTEEGKAKVQDWDGLMNDVFSILPMSDNAQVLVNLGMIHRDGEWIPYWEKWIENMRHQGWRRFGWYVWDQQRGLPGDWNGRLAPSHEFIFHFNQASVRPVKHIECNLDRANKSKSDVKKGKIKTSLRSKDGSVKNISSPESVGQTHKIPDSVWRFERHMANDIARKNHPATFPVSLPEFAMQSWPGSVYEPFCGSGTTLIAAEKQERICYGMEISPQYCDVIIKRWQDFTGKEATLESSGLTFSEVQNGRTQAQADAA